MKQKRKDPVRKFGGRSIPGIVLIILIPALLIGGGFAWFWSSDLGGFEEVRKLASVKCLGCLGLDPVVPGFSEFWVEYPGDHDRAGEDVDHSDKVISIIENDEVEILVLFFWTQGCVPCAEQWDEMVEKGIASGKEDGGIQGDRYDKFRMISTDAADDDDGFYVTYRPTGKETGVPMTTFIFQDTDGSIKWWSHYGKMDIGPFMDIIEDIVQYLEAARLKDDYDDISSIDDHH